MCQGYSSAAVFMPDLSVVFFPDKSDMDTAAEE
jgi:hypothetical protein